MTECPICCELLDTSIASLRCGHVYHKLCIEKWLKGKNGSCPTCRAPCAINQVIHLHYEGSSSSCSRPSKANFNCIDQETIRDLKSQCFIATTERNRAIEKLEKLQDEQRRKNKEIIYLAKELKKQEIKNEKLERANILYVNQVKKKTEECRRAWQCNGPACLDAAALNYLGEVVQAPNSTNELFGSRQLEKEKALQHFQSAVGTIPISLHVPPDVKEMTSVEKLRNVLIVQHRALAFEKSCKRNKAMNEKAEKKELISRLRKLDRENKQYKKRDRRMESEMKELLKDKKKIEKLYQKESAEVIKWKEECRKLDKYCSEICNNENKNVERRRHPPSKTLKLKSLLETSKYPGVNCPLPHEVLCFALQRRGGDVAQAAELIHETKMTGCYEEIFKSVLKKDFTPKLSGEDSFEINLELESSESEEEEEAKGQRGGKPSRSDVLLSKQKENLLLSRRGFKQLNSNKFGSSRVPSTCSFTKKRKFVNRTASSFQPKVKKKVVEVKRIERKNSITNFFTKK
eukprot:g3852.t1